MLVQKKILLPVTGIQRVLYCKCNMKVFPQCKVIGPYNYDSIIHNIETNYAKRQDIGQTIGKIHLI